jgi:fructokinase
MNKKIVCFGEMLWDMLPSGRQIGGAPLNVALHLRNLNVNPSIISRIGSDDLGQELLKIIENRGLDTKLVQVGKSHLTGIVKANTDKLEDVKYKIVYPVSWDYIELSDNATEEVKNADIFIFGSLAARNQKSKETLFSLLNFSKFNILDLNLREPYYNIELVEYLLTCANFLKVNEDELEVLCNWFNIESKVKMVQSELIRAKYNLDFVCVTMGKNGALLNIEGEIVSVSGYPVKVVDTIGSGDSFLASLVYKLLINGESPKNALDFACAYGAMVATKSGATPVISENEINSFCENAKKNYV